MVQPTNDKVYQLHIQLAYIEPPIWRRLAVSGQVTLFGLHQMLQVVMGWENYHLHQFIVGKTCYGKPDPEYGDTMKDDRRVRLRKIAPEVGASFIYEYDFGDGWQHVIPSNRSSRGHPIALLHAAWMEHAPALPKIVVA